MTIILMLCKTNSARLVIKSNHMKYNKADGITSTLGDSIRRDSSEVLSMLTSIGFDFYSDGNLVATGIASKKDAQVLKLKLEEMFNAPVHVNTRS